MPARTAIAPPLTVDNISKRYRVRGQRRATMMAVDGVSFTIEPGAAVGLVGASGSGKSTIASMITGSIRPTSGSIVFGDLAVHQMNRRALRSYHSSVQMVFQDPYGALNPLHTAEYTVSRPCQNYLGMTAAQARIRVHELLEIVGLTPTAQFASKLPHQLSGGQRQRVVIARALACDPQLIVADEPVSMLDAAVRAMFLNILTDFRDKLGTSTLFITHNLATANYLGGDIMVLYKGRVMESGPAALVSDDPKHPYSAALVAAAPVPDPVLQRARSIERSDVAVSAATRPPDPVNACPFAARCTSSMDRCWTARPPLTDLGGGRSVACFLF